MGESSQIQSAACWRRFMPLLKAVSVTLLVSWHSFDAGEGYLVTAS